jgi:response regulator of citrate/malate metabolism
VSALRGSRSADGSEGGLSATEVASASGSSRVTARRYLEYLVTSGVVLRNARYRSAGRPEVEYRLVPGGAQGYPAS